MTSEDSTTPPEGNGQDKDHGSRRIFGVVPTVRPGHRPTSVWIRWTQKGRTVNYLESKTSSKSKCLLNPFTITLKGRDGRWGVGKRNTLVGRTTPRKQRTNCATITVKGEVSLTETKGDYLTKDRVPGGVALRSTGHRQGPRKHRAPSGP